MPGERIQRGPALLQRSEVVSEPPSVCMMQLMLFVSLYRCDNHVNTPDNDREYFELEHQLGRVCDSLCVQNEMILSLFS